MNDNIGRGGYTCCSGSDKIDIVLIKAGLRSEKKKRACIKRSMNVSEAKEIYQDRTKWPLMVSAYSNGNPRK